MERDIQPDFGVNAKKEIEDLLDELAIKKEYKVRSEILKSINKQDEELAQMERQLLNVSMRLTVMCIGRTAWWIAGKMIYKYLP